MIFLVFRHPDQDDDPGDLYYFGVSRFVLGAFDNLISAKNYVENLFVETSILECQKERLFSWKKTGQTDMFLVEYTFKDAKRRPLTSMKYFIEQIKLKY